MEKVMTAAENKLKQEFTPLKDDEHYERLAADYSALKGDLKALRDDFAAFGAEAAHRAKGNVQTGLSAAEEQTREAVESAADEFHEMQRQAEKAIRKKPITAVAAALAIGYFLSAARR
jgi:ElaB/YqjD/DUF883 family membrane-anchored ribosome-binding protein